MSDLRPKPAMINLSGKEYGLLFTINAIDDIQDKFDAPISDIGELMQDYKKTYKVLRYLLTVLINEAIDDAENGEPHVTEKYIGRKLTPDNIPALQTAIFAAFSAGSPETDDPNAPSE